MKKTSWDKQVEKVVPSVFYMLSSSCDNQQSEEAHNTSKFELPNPAGKSGGACTSSFLQQQYETGNDQSWVETLQSIKSVLRGMGYNQTPTLSCSRTFDINSPMSIVPAGSGRRRALLIGINYVGQKGELTACHNDCLNIKEYLVEVHGFNDSEMLILMDDGKHKMPTKANIENAMCLLCKYSQPNDVVFVSFSGHGGNVKDENNDEEDGYDETLIPVDFQTAGHIVDDDIINMLVKPMPKDVTVTVLMDCCHSGTVLDLPYKISADDTEFSREENFNMDVVTEPKRSGRGNVSYEPTRRRKKPSEAKKESPKKKDEDLAPNAPIGPKIAPNGLPVLPIRKAVKVSDLKEDDDNNEDPSPEQAKNGGNDVAEKEGDCSPVKEKKKKWRLFGKKK